MTTLDEMQAELARLRNENVQLKSANKKGVSFKVSEKGGLSVYGLGRFPITLYPEQWEKLLTLSDQIKSFIEENRGRLKWKDAE